MARLTFGAIAAAIAIACGGKVDGPAASDTKVPPPTTGVPDLPPLDPDLPPRSDLGARLAAPVANAYCATFDKCCQTQGLTPINVATCLSYTEARVNAHTTVYARAQTVTDAEIAACTAAIDARVARCSSTDAKWWGPGDGSITTSLFVPASVAKACGSFLDLPRRAPTRSCGAGSSCDDGTTCAIDECAPAAQKGGACAVPADCLDGDDCTSAVCATAARVLGACTSDTQCPLGLVCQGSCTSPKDSFGGYHERHSPYRVSLETCQIFAKL